MSTENPASILPDQPPPENNKTRALWPQVIQSFAEGRARRLGEPMREGLLGEMRERDRLGRERYGTPLQAHNGRDPVVDALQEALDLRVYLEQAVAEDTNYPEIHQSIAYTEEAIIALWRLRCSRLYAQMVEAGKAGTQP